MPRNGNNNNNDDDDDDNRTPDVATFNKISCFHRSRHW
jgi:hypothetical protein